MSRREFTKAVKVEIIRRATRDGVIHCEQCGLAVKRFAIDHIKADALEIDKSRKLTAADGQLLCDGGKETCHGKKTFGSDIPVIAKAKRQEAARLIPRDRAPKLQGAPFKKVQPKAPIGRVRIDKSALPILPRRGI